MVLVFLLEEKSMKFFLDGFLPRILPKDVTFYTIPHEGKSDLRKSIPNKLRGWNIPNTKFIIVHDQDTNDCRALKQDLSDLCTTCGKEVLIRIACHELESWYWGDIRALELAYGKKLSHLSAKKSFRTVDDIVAPKRELQKILPEHQQIEGAKKLAKYIEVDRNTSKSFQVFVEGIKKLCSELQPRKN